MKFGKVENVDDIKFEYKKAPPFILGSPPKDTHPSNFSLYFGAPAWANKDWVGKIYPPKTPQRLFLKTYAEVFNTIELNSTHYNIPTTSTIKKWLEQVPPHFKFCPKFPQIISHQLKLQNCDDWLNIFIESIETFGDSLGTSFLQLPPYFTPQDGKTLISFLEKIPPHISVAVEFRNEAWFSNNRIWQRTLEVMTELKKSVVITDTAGRRDVLHLNCTTPTTFIRFVGNNLHPTDYVRINIWVKMLQKWRKQGLKTAYFIIHEPEELFVPELAQYFVNKVNEIMQLNLKPIHLINDDKIEQGTLF